jgi:hypothetical protein
MLAALAGVAAFGYCILYTAATSSRPLETPRIRSSPSHSQYVKS